MSDGVALPALALLVVALALVWPQGQGRRSPGPFGHPLAPMPIALPPMPKGPLTLRGPEPPAKSARP